MTLNCKNYFSKLAFAANLTFTATSSAGNVTISETLTSTFNFEAHYIVHCRQEHN